MNAKRMWFLVLCLAMAAPTVAQMDMTEIAEKIGQNRAKNAQKTMDYSWTKRTEVKVKGEVKSITTELVRYTIEGEVQTTPISQNKAKGPKGIRGKVAKKKGAEMQDWMADLAKALRPYSLPSPESLTGFLDKAVVVPDGDNKRLFAEGVVKPGDSMTMWIDASAGLTRTEVMTEYDGAGVQLSTDHATTPDGFNYVARTVISVPAKEIEMTVENFSYKLER